MPPALKPPARAHRLRAIRHAERSALTGQAIEALFGAADVMTEGRVDAAGCWYGSILITIDLAGVRQRCRGLDDPAELARFLDVVEGSVRVRLRAHRLACAQLYERFPGHAVGTASIETRFSRGPDHLRVDVDLEASIEQPSERSGT